MHRFLRSTDVLTFAKVLIDISLNLRKYLDYKPNRSRFTKIDSNLLFVGFVNISRIRCIFLD